MPLSAGRGKIPQINADQFAESQQLTLKNYFKKTGAWFLPVL